MNIAILGAGKIGSALGTKWAQRGHTIVYGVRNPASPKTRAALENSNARAATIAEAIQFGEVVALAVPWNAVRETLRAGGNWRGKILIDATNRVGARGADEEASAAATVAKWANGARVFKAFNTMGWETLRDPNFGGTRASAFVCGDDATGKAIVMQLAQEMDLDVVDAGNFENVGLVEALALLWIRMMIASGKRDNAFAFVRR